jgi:hypothetical protein
MCPNMDSKLGHELLMSVKRKIPLGIHVKHRGRARCNAVGPSVAKTTDQPSRFDKLIDNVERGHLIVPRPCTPIL